MSKAWFEKSQTRSETSFSWYVSPERPLRSHQKDFQTSNLLHVSIVFPLLLLSHQSSPEQSRPRQAVAVPGLAPGQLQPDPTRIRIGRNAHGYQPLVSYTWVCWPSTFIKMVAVRNFAPDEDVRKIRPCNWRIDTPKSKRNGGLAVSPPLLLSS